MPSIRIIDIVVVSTTSFGRMSRKPKHNSMDNNPGEDTHPRKTRSYGSATAGRASLWSHYLFRQRLKSSAFSRPGKYVVETSEEYTTRTCGVCGQQNPCVGGSAVFKCPACEVQLDRDVNGARNIGLLVLSAHWSNAASRCFSASFLPCVA